MRRFALALAAVSIATPALALPATLPPIEQCGGDPGFTRFRNALKETVRKKDRDALLRMLSPKVLVNFGGAAGPEAFAGSWDFGPGAHGIWDQLEIMLRMGCARDGDVRLIPSLIQQLEPFSDDALYDARLSLPGAKLFKERKGGANALAVAPWTLVTATDTSGDLWTGVRLSDGSTGWMSDDDLYEPVGYRIVIEKLRGKWMITAFVAGD